MGAFGSLTLASLRRVRRAIGTAYGTAICCSKIDLALLIEAQPGAPSGDRITSRTFHIPACGGLMLHERTAELLEIFREDESCACFEGIEELATKISELLDDDAKRERIAECGREVVMRGHSWDHRVQTVLDHYRQMSDAGRNPRPTPKSFTDPKN